MSTIRYMRARPAPFLGGAALIVLLITGLLFAIDDQCNRWSQMYLPVPAHLQGLDPEALREVSKHRLPTVEEFLGAEPDLVWQGRYLCDGREPSGAVIWLWIGSLALLGIVALTVASTIAKFIDRVLFALFAVQPFRAMVRRWRSYPKDSR